MVVDQALPRCQQARAGLGLRGGEVVIPDRPGIDIALHKGGIGVGRLEVGDVDVVRRQAGFLQRLDQQVMRVGAFGHGDALALEIGQGLERGILRHQDALARRRGRFIGDIPDLRTGGRLGEYRRRFAADAEIDAAAIHAFENRHAGGKLGPFHRDAMGGQALVQITPGFEDDKGAEFLVADGELPGPGFVGMRSAQRQGAGQHHGQRPQARFQNSMDHGLSLN